MSYCRWTDKGGRSDIYCYADVLGGWTTHVASSRVVAGGTQSGVLPRARPIGLPHDGQTFRDPTLEAFRIRVADLRHEGYRVPPYVLERIDEEIASGDDGAGLT